jgi:D-Tyr-tRNAtyr deacylase
MSINFEDDRMQSIEAANDASTLSEKVMQLKDLEDEIANAEESVKKLKEQARIISQIEIPQMMETMHIKKLKLKDGESVEVTKIYSASIAQGRNESDSDML